MVYGKRRSKVFKSQKEAKAAIESARFDVAVTDSRVQKLADKKWEAKIVHHMYQDVVPAAFEGGGVESVILSE